MRGAALATVAWLAVLLQASHARGALPAVDLSYRINVRLDPEDRGLSGRVEISWTNPSPTPVQAVPLHLYLNAFSNTETTWMREALQVRVNVEELLELDPDPWGFIELTSVRRVRKLEVPLEWSFIRPDDGNPLDESLVEVHLDEPLPPGGTLRLRLEFRGRLPRIIARTGGHGDFFFVAQWFPKLVAFEQRGTRGATQARFAVAQFHSSTEFYSNFADYDVTIDVPEGWTVGATGSRQSTARSPRAGRSIVRYAQRAVHDFAFVAGRALHDRTIRYDVPGDGPPVDIRYLVPKGTEHQLPRWRRAIEGSLEVLGRRVGPYPYGTLTVVCPPFAQGRSGGMEYPTLITGLFSDPLWDRFPLASVRLPELVLVHEFGHQYFYGLLASNEREEAFLDEGFNSYWESEILREVYGNEAGGSVLGRRVDLGDRRTTLLAQSTSDIRESVRKRPSWLFYPRTWASQIYDRSAVTLRTAAQLYGQDVIDAVFAAYFRAYAFHHPGLEDFLAVAHERGGAGLAGFLHEAFTRPEVPDYRVAMASAERWESPLGRVRGLDGPRLITEENRDPHGEIALDPTAREEDGRLLIEVTDPGWVGPSEDRRGSVTRRMVTPRWGDATSESDDEEAYFESRVRLEGPAWEHLPVSVLFRFSDGALVRDEWDGRAAWRAYRFLRGSPLAEVQIDPEKRIALDVRPENNARSVATDRGFALAWGLWFLALAGWWIGGLALWI